MNKIKSFTVNHKKLSEGIYTARTDGDVVTYDLRFCRPNSGVTLDNSSMHTVEHMIATFARNSDIGDDVVYFGPMGCQTGFYLLVRNSVPPEKVLEAVKDSLKKTIEHTGDVFGASEEECGNYKTLDLEKAKQVCKKYLDIIKDLHIVPDYDDVNKAI